MEHPIPQNVTSFQFHLIGDMTLKQFSYLAAGMIIAYLAFLGIAPVLPFLAWPIISLSSILGVAFAFIPIADRPLDYWLRAYFKAVYSPAKRSWKKNGRGYAQDPLFPKRLEVYTSMITPVIASVPIPVAVADIPTPPPTAPAPLPATDISLLPSGEDLAKTVELARQAQVLQTKIIESERQLNQIKTSATMPHANPTDYTNQVNSILANLQNLVVQASQIKQQLAVVTKEPETIKSKVPVTIVAPTKPKQTQITLTSFPNVINGIAMDAVGNYLEGVVVVIYDKEGLPVRALKTNKLGQFSGSTPLPNGTYRVELEKESLVFDVLQMELDGKVLPPLTVAAKRLMPNG